MDKEKLYYYTDFNTFKLILEYGTLRFKESTSSNDKLDTVQLYNDLLEMAKAKYDENGISPEQKFYFDMLKHNGAKSNRISLVACFTDKADSRLLWDAYTMHRKDRVADRYNGVCIEFDKEQLVAAMEQQMETFDIVRCQKIIYGFDKIHISLDSILNRFSADVETLSKDEDQSQDIIKPIAIPFTKKELVLKKCLVFPLLKLVDDFDAVAPYYKHSFWREECETRALLSIKAGGKKARELYTYTDGSRYFDLPISKDCITKVILGPEFSVEDTETVREIKGQILFDELLSVSSEGTNIITNK